MLSVCFGQSFSGVFTFVRSCAVLYKGAFVECRSVPGVLGGMCVQIGLVFQCGQYMHVPKH